MPCACAVVHKPRLIVLTGGPGAGKTATLEMLKQSFCKHVQILREAASIIFGGGFPRAHAGDRAKAAQRAIFFVQRELEAVAATENPAIILCDRGTVDSLAYWPGPGDFWASVGTTHQEQLARYDMVIHLRTPAANNYNQANPLRTESASEAAAIDARILQAWEGHPHRVIVDNSPDFLTKAARVIELIHDALPPCCHSHATLPHAVGAGRDFQPRRE